MSEIDRYYESRFMYVHCQRKGDLFYAEKLVSEFVKAGVPCFTDIVEDYSSNFLSYIREKLSRVDVAIFVASDNGTLEKGTLFDDPITSYFENTDKVTFGVVIVGGKARHRRSGPIGVEGLRNVYFIDEEHFERASEAIVTEILKFIHGEYYYSKHLFYDKFPPNASDVDRKLPLNEGKLILVGRGEVGKTSLVRRLGGHVFRGDECKTQGINITNLNVEISNNKYIMHIWDFGGQEIMHATHQFFLTERSLYIVVLNGREGAEDFDVEYWLKQIESFGSTSPVIIVQNKISQHEFELNYRWLRSKYPQIRAFVKTDCKDDIGIDSLRSEIEAAVSQMPEIALLIPESWLVLKRKLENMNASFIGYEGYRRLCHEAGIDRSSDMETLSWVLHCLGIALNYRDDSRLRETSVLKAEWITKAIYLILNASMLAERRGELHIDDLNSILPLEEYPTTKHFFVIELMRKFSLCFTFPDNTDKYLIPELLGKEEPDNVKYFDPKGCLNFEYHYGVLPEGLLPRFIVRSHTLSEGQKRWRSGAILVHENCEALVVAEATSRRVLVRVKGNNAGARRRLLALVRYDLERINSEFKDRLDAQAKVPLPSTPSFCVDYTKLAAFEMNGVAHFPECVDGKVININVSELLNGVDLEPAPSKKGDLIMSAKSVFISYSHKDEGLRNELDVHLKLLSRQGVISTWHDRKILPGTEWNREIDDKLLKANIIILLVSADFIASNYVWENEIAVAMRRHEAGEAIVVPVMVRACDWSSAPFAKLQGLPKDMLPITSWDNRDAAWTDVAKGIRNLAEQYVSLKLN